MCSVQYFRELISDRLTAAAQDIFAEFEKTIIQYEEAMERQRRLLTALRRKPATKAAPQLYPAASPPESNRKPRRSPGPKQKTPTPELKEIKKEEEELCCSQEVELLLQHQETNTEISHESKDNSQASDEMEHLLRLRIPKIHLHRIDLKQHSVQRTEEAADSPPSQQSRCSVDQSPPEPLSFSEGLLSLQLVLKQEPEDSDGYEPKPQMDRVWSDSHSETTGQKPESRDPEDATSAGDFELRKERRSVADSCAPLEHTTEMDKKLLTCDLCDKTFKFKSLKKKHDRVHKGGMRHFCRMCGKGFTQSGDSLAHSRTHVHRRKHPFREQRSSIRSGSLRARIRNHNLWRRFSCKLCGKSFIQSGSLLVHMRVHTGEKPFS
ncbi:zinc finger protein 768 [Oryzias melastigma]|uniref:Zinc finger protein 768-like n=1 Tax=Oryzias melastigma TaxID=30732 RepID=A0A3B3B6M0_ORYME|nr:zinc finger protein 768 [Oryzias melastigma]